MPRFGRPPAPWRQRLAWFVLLYCGSLAAFTALVFGLRAIVPH
jgi:hypothetical protein